jgi:hypothetical protein
VDQELCEAAFDLLALAYSHNSAGMLAATEARTLVCPAPGQPLPITVFSPGDVCDGAAAGEVRGYFTASGRSGEGQAQSPVTFAKSLADYLSDLPTSPAFERDAYGAGNLVIAAVSCFRTSGASGTCTGEFGNVVLTSVVQGERDVTCLKVYRPPASDGWALSGLGCGQPLEQLYAFNVAAASTEGIRGTFENYPWTPRERKPLPPAVMAALRARLPVQAPLEGECMVGPRTADIALCYSLVTETPSGLAISFGYPGTSGGWKATLTLLPDGRYRVDSVERQFI